LGNLKFKQNLNLNWSLKFIKENKNQKKENKRNNHLGRFPSPWPIYSLSPFHPWAPIHVTDARVPCRRPSDSALLPHAAVPLLVGSPWQLYPLRVNATNLGAISATPLGSSLLAQQTPYGIRRIRCSRPDILHGSINDSPATPLIILVGRSS
jgi:hypothetical protein